MELEREKARFFTTHAQELQFVYSASAPAMFYPGKGPNSRRGTGGEIFEYNG